jgi:hypothetical protein
MTRTAARSFRLVLSGLAGLSVLLVSDNVSFERPFPEISSAEARIGRPLTPMSRARARCVATLNQPTGRESEMVEENLKDDLEIAPQFFGLPRRSRLAMSCNPCNQVRSRSRLAA